MYPAQASGNGRPAQAQPIGPRRAPRWRPCASCLWSYAVKQGFDEAQVQAAVQRQTGKSIDDLTADELGFADRGRSQQAQPDAGGPGRLVRRLASNGHGIERGRLFRWRLPRSLIYGTNKEVTNDDDER